jgi:hypothetical protein
MEFNNLKSFKSEDSKTFLLTGNVSITNCKKNGVVIPALNDQDCNIVIPQSLSHLLNLISNSPVTKNNITIYDQEGNIFNKYLSTRETNKPGNLFYKTSTKMTLNGITIPPGDKNFLLLPDYPGAEACKLESTRNRFIECDYPSNFEEKNLTIFTTKKVINFGIKFPSTVEILVLDSDSFLESVIEYFFGKHFGDTSTFIKTLTPSFPCKNIVSLTKDNNITISCRKEGKIEFFTNKEEISSDFVILMKSEEISSKTHLMFNCDKEIIFEMTSNENISNVLIYADIYYNYKIVEKKTKFCDFYKENTSELFSFMLDNHFSEFIQNDNIIDIFFNKIHDNLYSLILNNFISIHSKTPHMKNIYSHSPLQINDLLRQESGGDVHFD